jgi:hypothetical protein
LPYVGVLPCCYIFRVLVQKFKQDVSWFEEDLVRELKVGNLKLFNVVPVRFSSPAFCSGVVGVDIDDISWTHS